MVRRLPVIQSKAADDAAAEARPPWHWVLIGAGFSLTIWLPLLAVAVWLSARLALGALPIAVSFAASCFAAGTMVGRFGGRSGKREAALGGLLGAAVPCLLAAVAGVLSPWPVAAAALATMAVCAGVSAWLGGRLGVRLRPSLDRTGA